MTFHIGGDFATNFGLDYVTNDLFVGGWSRGATKSKIWHAGNDGSGSGLDADKVDGYHASTSRTSANTIPIRNSSGYLEAGWINTTSGQTTVTPSDVYVNTNDGYIRKMALSTFGGKLTGVVRALKETDQSTRSFGTGWGVGKTWSWWDKSAGSAIFFASTVPMRNDSTSWGGAYCQVEFAVNGSSTWTSLGDTGYDVVMANGTANISHWTAAQLLTNYTIITATRVRFRFKHRSYDGTMTINGSNGITNGPSDAFGFTQITLLEIR